MADQQSNFEKRRIKDLQEIFSDPVSARNRYNKTSAYQGRTLTTAKEVRDALENALSNKTTIIDTSKKTYATNPIYAKLVDYYSDMFLWRYTVIPHQLSFKKPLKESKYQEIYELMLDVVSGLSLEIKLPLLLSQLYIEGGAFFTTYKDEESITIDTISFPSRYCRKIGETQFGTGIMQLDYSYFDSLGLNNEDKEHFLASFPDEIRDGYQAYTNDSSNKRWQTLDPHYSSCLLLNEKALPNLIYSLGSILDYEQYSDNELERNSNRLKYIVVHKMPLYQDTLIFETDEVKAIHKSLAKIVNTSEKTRLITTYGDVSLEKVGEDDTAENKTLINAYKSIFNNIGLNDIVFTGDSAEALRYSVLRDKATVWKYVQQIMNFYNLVVNNYFDFGKYQCEVNMLPISFYTYENDIKIYRENATLGVGKLDFMIASGVKQKNIQDRFDLEEFLDLTQITPLQTSYTQTNADRESEESKEQDSKDTSPSVKQKKTNTSNVVRENRVN